MEQSNFKFVSDVFKYLETSCIAPLIEVHNYDDVGSCYISMVFHKEMPSEVFQGLHYSHSYAAVADKLYVQVYCPDYLPF